MSTPRGIRNNNPGNIRRGPRWEGSLSIPDQKALNDGKMLDEAFAVFRHPIFGIRALAVLLRNYKRLHGVKTLTALVKRYAPKSDNNPTKKYVQFLADRLGVTPRKQVDLADYETLRKLIPAIIDFENGKRTNGWYSHHQIEAGLQLASLDNTPKLYGGPRS